MGAIGTRLSLRPLLQKVGEVDANLGHIEPRERGRTSGIQRHLRAKRSNPSRRTTEN